MIVANPNISNIPNRIAVYIKAGLGDPDVVAPTHNPILGQVAIKIGLGRTIASVKITAGLIGKH